MEERVVEKVELIKERGKKIIIGGWQWQWRNYEIWENERRWRLKYRNKFWCRKSWRIKSMRNWKKWRKWQLIKKLKKGWNW